QVAAPLIPGGSPSFTDSIETRSAAADLRILSRGRPLAGAILTEEQRTAKGPPHAILRGADFRHGPCGDPSWVSRMSWQGAIHDEDEAKEQRWIAQMNTPPTARSHR